MIYIDTSVEDWCKKYNLIPFISKCPNCRHENAADIPYITSDYVGLLNRKCANCNGDIFIDASIPMSKKEKELWMSAMSGHLAENDD